MRKLLALVVGLALTALGFADTEFLGIFIGGNHIGYSSTATMTDRLNGVVRNRTDSKTVLDAALLGAAMKTVIDSRTWYDQAKRPLRMEFKVESAGRVQTTVATFKSGSIQLEMENGGQKSTKTLTLPTDAPVVDDAVSALLADGGSKPKAYYVLDPMTASLVKNTVSNKGKGRVTVQGKEFDATLIVVSEPRATMTLYMGAKGDVIKIDGPMGMEMIPMSEAEATAGATGGGENTDLATATAIRPSRSIGDASALKSLALKITGHDLGALPSDAFQSVNRAGKAWKVVLHPFAMNTNTTIAQAQKAKSAWTRPTLNIPARDATFVALAKKLIGPAKTVAEASKRVRDYVYDVMKPNAGIGVLRDAREILKTKEGVCRDYATLTATLLRAGKVPTRLVSGLVLQDDQYFYHAWVEVWDGKHWSGVDSTRPKAMLGADHLKLAQGNVEEAFNFTFLDHVKIDVLDVRRN